jgi:hypothetical protein
MVNAINQQSETEMKEPADPVAGFGKWNGFASKVLADVNCDARASA